MMARDNPASRVNRSKAYAALGRCQEAIADARAARLMGSVMLDGYQTPTEAHEVPVVCS